MAEEGEAPAEEMSPGDGELEQTIESLPEQGAGDAAVETQEEGINTVDDGLAAEPSVIGTYTETQPGEVEAAVAQEEEQAGAAAGDDAEAAPAAEDAATQADADEAPPKGSRPASAAAAAPELHRSRPPSAAPAPPSRSGSIQGAPAAPAEGSRPTSAVPASTAPPGSRPASAVPAATPPPSSRPASAVPAAAAPDDAPAPSGSRPTSALSASAAAPAASATPPAGSRPASSASAAAPAAAPAGSRPASAALVELPPPATGSRPASGTAATAPAPDEPPAPSSQPGTSQSAVRPPSSGAAAPPPPVASSRPPSALQPAPASGSRPASGVPPAAQPTSVSAAAGSSRPPSAQPPLDQRPPSALDKVQAAEAHGYVQAGTRVVDVQVDQGPGLPHRMVRVLVDLTQADAKPYLGGMRNKRTGAVYHHAVTQTPKAPRYAGVEPKIERQTQTVKISTRGQQTVREAATQMERPGVVVDTTYDRPKTPGKYQTSEERLAIVEAATQCIQRWVRGWIGRKRAAVLRKHKMEREMFLQDQEMKAQQAAEEHRRREIERRMHPRTAADFEILYNELEAWRLQETRKIKEAGLPADKQQEVLQQLLHKETKLLQTIDRLKINANHENKDMRIQRTLGDMSKPKQYELKNGKKVEVHTPFTTRAKELMQLYNGLNLPMLTIDERLDVLLHVKWTVKEFDCNLTREIVSLIDREADLLNRGRSPGMLEGLRKRIASMFLNFIETPEFNPESARFQVAGQDFEAYLYSQVEKSTAPTSVTYQRTSKWDT